MAWLDGSHAHAGLAKNARSELALVGLGLELACPVGLLLLWSDDMATLPMPPVEKPSDAILLRFLFLVRVRRAATAAAAALGVRGVVGVAGVAGGVVSRLLGASLQ